MTFDINPEIHMWFGIALTFLTFVSFAREKWPLEITAVVLLSVLLLFGNLFPLLDETGDNMLNAKTLLVGFANPSLVAVIALLVIGQALVQTAVLTPITNKFLRLKDRMAILGLISIFFLVVTVSAFMNNTPLVIIAIPILQALGSRIGISSAKLMMPLSFVAILGGMTTLVGSSTNMLVSTALNDLGYEEFSFFDFTIPGAMLAGVGIVYVCFVMPYLLTDRSSMSKDLKEENKEFIAELDIHEDSKLIGDTFTEDHFEKLPEISVKMVQRDGVLILPPFEDYEIAAKDILIVAATKETLFDLLAIHPGFLLSEKEKSNIRSKSIGADMLTSAMDDMSEDSVPEDNQTEKIEEPDTTGEKSRVLLEIMITPNSRLVDRSVAQIDFEKNYHCMVLGIERQSNVVRRRVHQMRIESGDVMLVAGDRDDLRQLNDSKDIIVLAGTRMEIPETEKAPHAGIIFLTTIICAATGILPIAVAAVVGAVSMLVFGCLNVRQMVRAFDRKIFFLVGSALALGSTLQSTGGATYLANLLLELEIIQDPFMAASLLFIIVAIATNLLTNNACAILFTPIAVNLALQIGVDPMIFATTVVFAANCSFASPIGYQTNLLVMGPGHYKFNDFVKAGIPLVIVIWIAYCFLAKFYYHL